MYIHVCVHCIVHEADGVYVSTQTLVIQAYIHVCVHCNVHEAAHFSVATSFKSLEICRISTSFVLLHFAFIIFVIVNTL